MLLQNLYKGGEIPSQYILISVRAEMMLRHLSSHIHCINEFPRYIHLHQCTCLCWRPLYNHGCMDKKMILDQGTNIEHLRNTTDVNFVFEEPWLEYWHRYCSTSKEDLTPSIHQYLWRFWLDNPIKLSINQRVSKPTLTFLHYHMVSGNTRTFKWSWRIYTERLFDITIVLIVFTLVIVNTILFIVQAGCEFQII